MLITASCGAGDVAVEVDEACQTLEALKALLQAALPTADVEKVVLTVDGRCLSDDEAVCGLGDGDIVELSPTAAARAVTALREEGLSIDLEGFCVAASRDSVHLCGLYLDAGVGDATGTGGTNPLHAAAEANCVAVCTLLLDQGWLIDELTGEEHDTPLHLACDKGHVEVSKLLLERGCAVNATNGRGCTPLHYSCEHSRPELTELLLDHGARVSVKDGNGYSAFFYAAYKGWAAVCKLLLDRGNPVDEKEGVEGDTALHIVCEGKSVEICKLLLDRGFHIEAMNAASVTPLPVLCVRTTKT